MLVKEKNNKTSTKYAILLFRNNNKKGGIIMLKSNDDYNTSVYFFEDFILLIFVLIDDLYQQYVPVSVKKRRNIEKAKLSDTECITIAICGELLGIDSEKSWYSFVKRNYSQLFPKMCSRSRFNRTCRNLLQVTELLMEKLSECIDFTQSSYRIVDSFPLPVCKFGRARYAKAFRMDGATYGKCPSKKETYYGYKVHVMTTLEGFITQFEVTPANVDDRPPVFDLTDGIENIIILGDKGYTGKEFCRQLSIENKIMYALKRSGNQEDVPAFIRRLIFKNRRRIETTFSQLTEQLNAENVLAKSLCGLCTRLLHKILGYNLCIVVNYIFNITLNISQIKQLIF